MLLSASTFALPTTQGLTREQLQLKQAIFTFIKDHLHDAQPAVFMISGDAGSGKSAVLNTIFTELEQQVGNQTSPFRRTDNHLLVNHNEMLKIYRELAGQNPFLHKNRFEKPTPFINRYQKKGQYADVVFVDEAQLLLSQSDPFNHFNGDNQLAELLKLAQVLVLVLDFNQVVKLKSYWSRERIAHLLAGKAVKVAQLHQQLRMADDRVTTWVDQFVAGHLQPLPQTRGYELRVFDDGQPLFDWVKRHDRQSGLSRVLATTDFPFRVYTATPWYVTAGTLRLPWDRYNRGDRPWASQPQTINEVGSIYTIQGFDLNYAGVILGPSVTYSPKTHQIELLPEKFEDQTAFRQRKRHDLASLPQAQLALVKHVLNILLKRGRLGLGLYAVDPVLEVQLLKLAHQHGEDY